MSDEYEVTISESVAPPSDDGNPGPKVRTLDWRGHAGSEDEARQAAWSAWNEQYGGEREPAQPDVRVTKITD
jgi:hypothetical protein